MANVSQYSTSASSNNSASPDGAPEGWSPSDVNNWGREVMAALARWYQDTQGSLVTAGTGNAYTLATNSSHAALADVSMLAFRADRANTGAATLAVDGLAAKSIVKANGDALAADDIKANQLVVVCYNATVDAYLLVSAPDLPSFGSDPGEVPLVGTAGIGNDGELIQRDASGKIETSGVASADFLISPGTSSLPGLTSGVWRTPNASRPTLVWMQVHTKTDGTTDAYMQIDIDESGGTTSDYNFFASYADSSLGANAIQWSTTTFVVQAGASYKLTNVSDPAAGNFLGTNREYTL